MMTGPAVPWETMAEAPSDATIVDVLGEFRARGFGGSFSSRPGGAIECATCGRTSPATTFTVGALHRLEGASDPDDMLAIYALTCPRCAAGGGLVLAYGPHASDEDAAVLVRLDDVAGLPPVPRPVEGRG